MIDFSRIERYRENNRIEAKRASGGFPGSVWETYSAFANTLGGVILLGVEERKDKSLHPIELPSAEALADEFWCSVNDPHRVSVNILRREDVAVLVVDGKKIVAITVPRARRQDKPVYIDGDVYKGSYRRNGEGDYRCEREDIEAMLRDAAIETDDMCPLEHCDLSLLKRESVVRFAQKCADCVSCGTEILQKVSAVNADGQFTLAGLLMFGRGEEIRKRLPEFSLVYRNCGGDIVFENLCDFFFYVSDRLREKLDVLKIEDDDSVFTALREALVNSIVNADYRGGGGVTVEEREHEISFTNSGGFRIDLDGARTGGVSDPRNRGLIRIISHIGSANGSGSGIPGIYTAWKKQGWREPKFKEEFSPDRITLTLSFIKRKTRASGGSDAVYRDMIISLLTRNISANATEIARDMGIGIRRTKGILSALVADGIAVVDKTQTPAKYRLKS